jgi:hypothetical protein
VLLVCTVYSEIALSRKPFGIGRMYAYTFLLRMSDTMTSHNIDLSSWDTLYSLDNRMINGAVGRLKIGRGTRSSRRKPNPELLCPPQIPQDLRQSVELLGRMISPSQGRYLTQTQTKQRHPCLEWGSNPRSQRSSERRQCIT